jgi:hypothetical protein
MRIRLIRKLALCLNGVDVSQLHVGDVVDLPERSARLLLMEGWAEVVDDASAAGLPNVPPFPSTT